MKGTDPRPAHTDAMGATGPTGPAGPTGATGATGPAREEDERDDERRENEARREARREERQDSGRYRLLSVHVLPTGEHLEPGTEVGAGTEYHWPGPPTQYMAGVDEHSEGEVNKLHRRLYGRDAPWHGELARTGPALPPYPTDLDTDERQVKEEMEAEPVSAQQAFERGHEEYRGQRLAGPPRVVHPFISKSGDRSPNLGPATPIVEEDEIRPRHPTTEMMPRVGDAPPKK